MTQPTMQAHVPRRLTLLLGGLAMFGPFSIDTIFPAFPHIGAAFGADKLAMQQSISVYLLAYAATSILHGPLSDAVGRRRVILAGLCIFALASAGCALSTSLPMLLAFRALQGLSAGVGLIVGRAVIRDLLDGADAQRLMAQVSMIFGIAPAIAPIVGGWLLGWRDWPAIFWFLVGFALLLVAATFRFLPETHPPGARAPLHPRTLLAGYLRMARDARFMRLSLAGSFNFGALFLYIASAPAFVMDILRLGERDFAWFFVPMIGGMMLGAFVSGRMAGRLDGVAQTRLGFACCLVAAVANIVYNGTTAQPAIPLAVVPMMLNSFGVALGFPILTLAILDLYPRARGAASSMQAFFGLLGNALVAGAISPMLSHSGLALAIGAAAFSVVGWAIWRWEWMHSRRALPAPTPAAAAYEPTDEM